MCCQSVNNLGKGCKRKEKKLIKRSVRIVCCYFCTAQCKNLCLTASFFCHSFFRLFYLDEAGATETVFVLLNVLDK